MIEEPYRWVEAINNRREYIEMQLASGSPIVALGCTEGILFVTISRGREKIFEIYDRIAMGAIGHPGDIERLRMAAIELASTEGFTRSAADVSLRRLAFYSLSPVMKTAFEQVYGAPYLARLLFAEVGATADEDFFLRLEYDGAIFTNTSAPTTGPDGFAVISGSHAVSEAMETHLRAEHKPGATLAKSLDLGLNVLAVAQLVSDEANGAQPSREQIAVARNQPAGAGAIEAALLERDNARAIRYRRLSAAEMQLTVGE